MKLYVQNTKIFIHPNSELEHFEKIKNEEYSSFYTWEFFSGIDYEFIELLHFKNLEEKNDFINNLKVFIIVFPVFKSLFEEILSQIPLKPFIVSSNLTNTPGLPVNTSAT